ncbi:pectinesterase inhibitor 10-like [Salvia hispanica]|uniref:pectinesterase inhibitor 10-like n=1 Tax=Salvia hispanica TaxID=49212 RepID=UPI0020092469|nr:pectinesterase inhibitor 10-like [Salvia hispanica]
MKTSHLLLHKNLILVFLCVFYSIPTTSCSAHPASIYVTNSCKTTLYPRLCNKALTKHAGKIKGSPKLLAMTALIATYNATQTTSKVLRELRRASECVEMVGDAVYELHQSIKRLDQSRKGSRQFFGQMDDVQTWVSAALTDDDTCMDDFKAVGRRQVLARGFVYTVARLTSISLTFINNYASL